jgi:hypothetical protein
MRKSFATHALHFLISTILARKSNAINTFLISAIHRFHETKKHRGHVSKRYPTVRSAQSNGCSDAASSARWSWRPAKCHPGRAPVVASILQSEPGGATESWAYRLPDESCHAWGFTLQMACSGHMPKPSVGFHNSPAPRLGNKHGRRFFQNFLIFLPAPD